MMDLKNTNYWKICGDAFNFLKQSLPVQDKDEYWDQVIHEADVIFKKYENTDEKDFAKDQVLSVVNELDHIYQRKRKRGELS